MSKWFRFAWLALRLSHVGKHRTAARSAIRTAGEVGDERLWSVTNATDCVRFCNPAATRVRDPASTRFANTCRVPIATRDRLETNHERTDHHLN